MPSLPPVFIEFLGSSKGVQMAMADAKVAMAEADEEGAGAFEKTGMLGAAAIAGLGLAAGEAAKKTVEMAADFDSQMTRVQTGAGEAAGNMKLVSAGVLSMAGQVGQSTEQLTSGLYTVESAGYHGSAALDVLKNSAEGAKVGAADLGTVADATTTAMNAYKMGADQSAQAVNALIATEGEGKTTLEALSGAMATVLPTAATAKVGLTEVLGAMATMTAQGTPAADAATYLRQTIAQLSNPSGKAAQEMQSLGLNSVQVAQNLGKNGLASTLEELTDAIQKKMGPAGTVLIQHLQDAAKDSTAYQKVLANLPPAQQTYIGALADMVGGTKAMQGALELTGPHLQDFKDNTAGIAQHVKEGGNQIEGWSAVQATLNQRLAEAKASAQALMIQIGQYLMPVVQAIVGAVANSAGWMTQHAGAAKVLAAVIGGVLLFALAALTAQLYAMAAAAAVNPVTWIILGVVALVAAIVALVVNWRSVWGEVKDIAEDVAHVAVAAWDWVGAETFRLWNDVSGAVVDTWHDITGFFSTAWHDVADPVVHGWDQLVQGTEERWHELSSAVVGVWHDITGFFSQAAHDVEAPVVDTWDRITDFFKKWWPLLLLIFLPPIGILLAIWNHFHQDIEDTAKRVWNDITGFFIANWNTTERLAEDAWNGIRDYIVHPVEDAWNWLVSTWNAGVSWLDGVWHGIENDASVAWAHIHSAIIDPVEDAWNWMVRTWNAGVSWLDGVWHGIENETSVIWAHIRSAIIDPVEDAWHSVTQTGGKIGDALDDAFTTAKNDVVGVLRDFENFGSDIVNGIVKGISGAAHFVTDKLKDLANDALKDAKSFLGIASPSRVMADEVGKWIPHGIAQGIAEHADVAHAAVGALTGALTAQPIGVPALAGGGIGASGQAGTGAVLEVTAPLIIQLDSDVLYKGLQKMALRYDRRNARPGLIRTATT
ncbi:phage tail tape measure protein [Kitasatospora sp. NBC_01266]|uniref:phage tail tape measure protein n=1 Tax=Kitasatospora sp. NBC_01266 TaxID=2903572 RepID=UPI002E37A58D|nr:phage tail tape measure protein [Kitasatospora sp. NBC_01266]